MHSYDDDDEPKDSKNAHSPLLVPPTEDPLLLSEEESNLLSLSSSMTGAFLEHGSDSVLSFETTDEDDFQKIQRRSSSRNSALLNSYMEQASMEASLVEGRNNNNNQKPPTGRRLEQPQYEQQQQQQEDGGNNNSGGVGLTKIQASGPLGRRRQSLEESIFVEGPTPTVAAAAAAPFATTTATTSSEPRNSSSSTSGDDGSLSVLLRNSSCNSDSFYQSSERDFFHAGPIHNNKSINNNQSGKETVTLTTVVAKTPAALSLPPVPTPYTTGAAAVALPPPVTVVAEPSMVRTSRPAKQHPPPPKPTSFRKAAPLQPTPTQAVVVVAEPAWKILQSHKIIPLHDHDNCHVDDDDERNEIWALHTLFEDFCLPAVSVEACAAILASERQRQRPHHVYDDNNNIPLPDPATIVQTHTQQSRLVALLQQPPHTKHHHHPESSSSSSFNGRSSPAGGGSNGKPKQQPQAVLPILLQLPVFFSRAVLRILVRLLSAETDAEYCAACFDTLPWKKQTNAATRTVDLTQDPSADPDHSTRRPHLQYSVARFQCTWMKSNNSSSGPATQTKDNVVVAMNKHQQQHTRRMDPPTQNSSSSQSLNNDSGLAVQAILSLWETSATLEGPDQPCRALVAPLARLLGLLATAGLTPQILRRMLAWAAAAQTTTTTAIAPLAQLSIVRALKTAAAGSARSWLWPKAAPRQVFCFGGSAGLQRTISGIASWPFRNDFGMALWFRAERFDSLSSDPVLLSVRTEDGGGIEVAVVPIEKGVSSSTTTDACTIALSIYDSGQHKAAPSHHLVVRGGCVLLPRIWYHVAVRHTRSRLKGVFSLSTRQQISVMLDGKSMLTESLPFPKISDADFMEDSSLLHSTLRRSLVHSSMNITLTLGSYFEGQTGALHVFNDNVSDASFRALYEVTGGSGGMLKRNHGIVDSWDAHRSDLVRKSRVLDVNMANDDADEIVFNQRRYSGLGKKRLLVGKIAAVIDLAEGDEQDDNDLPADLQKSTFGSKVFIAWDPRRTLGALALELHIGAHVSMDGVYSWGFSGAQDVISSTGGVQSLVPLFRYFLSGEIERSWVCISDVGNDAFNQVGQRDAVLAAIPDLLRLLTAFVQDHNDNARELLRCGGIDVIEQLLFSCKKVMVGKGPNASIFGALNAHSGLAFDLVESLLELRAACSNYVGLESKIYSRILFNVPLWLGGFNQIPGASLHTILLPMLSSLTRMNPDKVRDCVGAKEMVNALKEYSAGVQRTSSLEQEIDRYVDENGDASTPNLPLTVVERRQASNIMLGIIFRVVASGTSQRDLSPFLHLISFNLEADKIVDQRVNEVSLVSSAVEERLCLTVNSCSILLLLMQIRPSVTGLFESFAHSCGGVQGGASWILTALVNSVDDRIRSLGIRCLATYLDLTFRGADLPLSLSSLLQPSGSNTEMGKDVTSTVRRASTRFTQIAKGLAAVGPNSRSVVLPPSKLTARVVFKVRRQLPHMSWLRL